ncbi:uncharacterized protein LOC114972041 [Acropora millepora]|uniref:uncharacterized protein LOC114972041 n=1 Tax=Acropora millepora TaxID=45264 RepID=UPI001CF46324|nr:uncharacterized protein LOC114972041 [Acropora millepora]
MEVDGQQKSIVYRAGTIHGPSFDLRDRSIDKVWLVKDPKLYFPLNQDISQSTRSQERKSFENVCLWKTDIANLSEYFFLKEKFDGICQVELKDSTNANCTFKEEKLQEIQRCLKSFEWRRTTVPQCKGGFPLMDLSPLVQAVILYMKDHFPITPKELNFHAELKAASGWSWSDDYTQLSMKKVPFDDCRLKIAATEALKTWKKMEEELQSTRGNKIKGKGDKKLSDVRKAIDVLKKYTVQGASTTSRVLDGSFKAKVSEAKGEGKSGQAALKHKKLEDPFSLGRHSPYFIKSPPHTSAINGKV